MGEETTLRPRASATAPSVPSLALTIAAHPDPGRIGDRLVLAALAGGGEVALSRSEPAFCRPGRVLGAPLADRFLSRTPIRLIGAAGGRVRVVGSGTSIAIDGVAPEVAELGPLTPGAGVAITLAERVTLVLHLLEPGDGGGDDLGLVGNGSGMARVRREIGQVLDLDVPVLIRGETGTGKELVARALHERGARRARPFVSVNLGAIPRELAAAELFGAVRGAYSGANRDRDGLFRAADGGTLFLDEVGEASPEVQVMLLRVLETGELYPVGGDAPVAVDVRVVAATDSDLAGQIRDGRFKAPLYHRLAGHEVHLPPLRDRPEDVGLLFVHLARQILAELGEEDVLARRAADDEPWMPPSIATRLVRCRWPGNVRQLRNVARRIVIASRGLSQLRLDPRLAAELDADAPAAATPAPPAPAPSAEPIAERRRAGDVTEAEVVAALRAQAWDVKAAADHLGVPRSTMYDLISRFPSIRTAGDLTPAEIAASHRACGGDLERMAAALQVSRRALQRRVKELGLDAGEP